MSLIIIIVIARMSIMMMIFELIENIFKIFVIFVFLLLLSLKHLLAVFGTVFLNLNFAIDNDLERYRKSILFIINTTIKIKPIEQIYVQQDTSTFTADLLLLLLPL